jgi:hypothetical protein
MLVSMEERSKRREHAFAIRIWGEGGEIASRWRGRIDDLHTGERRYFGSLSELIEYIHRRIEPQPR